MHGVASSGFNPEGVAGSSHRWSPRYGGRNPWKSAPDAHRPGRGG